MKRHIPALLIASTLLLICGCRQNHQEAFSESTAAVPVPAHPATPQDTLSSVDEAVPSSLADVRPPDVKVRVRRGNALLLETEGLLLTAADTAVTRSATYSATALYEGEFAGLPQGMVNMTAAAASYRLLPSGDHFRPAAELRVAYDPDRLPMGYTPDDIYTSYYDSAAHAWVRLDRIAVDTANREIVSLTSHFTDFVNELLKAPEMPETQAFVPTAMTDLEAVNPLDGLTLIQPPTANNSGTANLSYPLAIPAGRNGMQPNLALTYNSGGGSGWLGVGWDIPVPAITLDTRWGVPRYSNSVETEIYLLNGEQLITKDGNGDPHKMPHRTNQQISRLPDGTQFYARFGDAHDSIIRHGDNPRNYWWKVVDRNGVTHYYGQYPLDSTFNSEHTATLSDNRGNIARWMLAESRDIYGNNVRYFYSLHTGQNGGRQIYLDSIYYTGYRDTLGAYSVLFRHIENTSVDIPVLCNNGFKEETDRLLCNIQLMFRDTIRTAWLFQTEYGYRSNFKHRLTSVTKIDTATSGIENVLAWYCGRSNQDTLSIGDGRYKDTAMHMFPKRNVIDNGYSYAGTTTSFSYHDAPAPTDIFEDEQTFYLDPRGLRAPLILPWAGKATALGLTSSSSWNAGGSGTIGTGIQVWNSTLSGGGNYTHSRSSSEGLMTLVDLDGDGLPDKVYVRNGRMYFCRHLPSEFGEVAFANPVPIEGPGHFLRENSSTNTFGAQLSIGAGGSASWPRTTSTTLTYFADVNGDGLVDIVDNGLVYFNYTNTDGNPSFSVYANSTPIQDNNDSLPSTIIQEAATTDCGGIGIFFDGEVDDSITCRKIWHSDKKVTIKTEFFLDEYRRYTDLGNEVSLSDGNNPPVSFDSLFMAEYRARLIDNGQSSIDLLLSPYSWDCSPLDNGLPDVEAVKVWIAPSTGQIHISSFVQLVEDTTERRRLSRLADGVIYTTQHTTNIQVDSTRRGFQEGSVNRILSELSICGDCHGANTHDTTITVQEGDMIFFRLRSRVNRDFDNVLAHQRIYYEGATDTFDTRNDFIVSGDHCFQAPANGKYIIDGNFEAPNNDYRLDIVSPNNHPSCNKTSGISINQNNNISPDETIRFFLDYTGTGTPQWGKVRCQPRIRFIPNGGDSLWNNTDTMTVFPPVAIYPGHLDFWNPSHYRTHPYRRLFGPLYNNWGQFAYHSLDTGARADTLRVEMLKIPKAFADISEVDTNSLKQELNNLASLDTSLFENASSLEEFQQEVGSTAFHLPLSYSSYWVEMTADPEHWAWVSYGRQSSIAKDTMSNTIHEDWYSSHRTDTILYDEDDDAFVSDTTLPSGYPSVPSHTGPVSQPLNGTPAKAVNKVNTSKSHSWSIGFALTSKSHSEGTNTIETDYLDLNGDRYPDNIGPSRVKYSQQWGGIGPYTDLPRGVDGGCSSKTESRGISFSASEITPERTLSSSQGNAKFTLKGDGSASGNSGNDGARTAWVDLNGDGLPDYVSTYGSVCLNTGYDFLATEHWNFQNIRLGVSGGASVSGGDDLRAISTNQRSIQLGAGVSLSANETKAVLLDINGDGMPDRVKRETGNAYVIFNLGNGIWTDSQALDIQEFNQSNAYNESVDLGATLGGTIFGIKATGGLRGSPYSASANRDHIQLVDINGDGLPDLVSSESEDEITVRYNRGGKTNLLRSATNFTGSRIHLGYPLSMPDRDQPSRHWQLTSVATSDPLNRNGGDSSLTRFSYASPYYNRYERTSLGYGTVTTSQIDTRNGSTYRIIERNYNNRDMMKRGKLTREMTSDGNNNPYIERLFDHTYLTLDGDTLDPCEPRTYTVHEATLTHYYEGGTIPRLTTGERYVYDRYHNVIRYTDLGDINYGDSLTAVITYLGNQSHNLIGLRSGYIVSAAGTTATRRATFAYNDEGKLIRQTLFNGSIPSTYDFEYDPLYGNLSRATLPDNDNNQRMHYAYTYDPVVHTYPARIDNAYGEHSTTTYNYRFGKPLSVTDPAGATMRYTYDFAGRLTSVRSPLNRSAQPSLVNRYHPIHYYHRLLPFGNPVNPSLGGHPYSVTVHFDDHGDTVTETAVICDGFGRVIQTKKGLTVEGVPMMQVSGRAVADAFGRTVEQYDPVVESSSTHRGEYNTNYDVNTLTSTTYDILDRTKVVAMPLGVTTHTAYSIGNDLSGRRRFVTTTTDPNGNRTTQYSDYAGRQVQVTDANGGITRFQYDNLGQLTRSTDPEGFHTHYTYDNLGRLIQRSHPDAGTTAYAYDPAGNITKQITPLGEIIFDYTYYRLAHKRYSDMDGNNVTYTYHLGGRIANILDGTGLRKLGYDALGNLVHDDRHVAIPNSNHALNFYTRYTYDSWGRMRSMTYPDGEQVDYTYRWGGDLFSVHGTKGADRYRYVDSIAYNALGQRAYIHYGNGTSATYAYDSLHRLTLLKSHDNFSNTMQEIKYAFDQASNITHIANNAPNIGPLGGRYQNYYKYDPLHRLTRAGGSDQYGFEQTFELSPAGRPLSMSTNGKVKHYAYGEHTPPHAPQRIMVEEGYRHTLHDLRWDPAGNLGQVSTLAHDRGDIQSRFLFWTEDSRLHTVVDDRHHSYYAYDHAGERTLKVTGRCDLLDINAWILHTVTSLRDHTVYPSPYVVLSNHGYTKHYYAGSERLAARLGGGFDRPILREQTDIAMTATHLFKQSQHHTNERHLNAPPAHTIRLEGHLERVFRGMEIEFAIPEAVRAEVHLEPEGLIQAAQNIVSDNTEPDVYFYHSDHLGSASWITDGDGKPVQHLQYLPYGEPFVNQRVSDYNERFTFTGKERDEETGYSYFGARYMDHDLMTSWLSVDPMADKYPSLSPYNYCAWNPIKLVDPDGRDVWELTNDGKLNWVKSAKTETIKIGGKSIFSRNAIFGTNNKEGTVIDLSEANMSFGTDQAQAEMYFEFFADNLNYEFSLLGSENAKGKNEFEVTTSLNKTGDTKGSHRARDLSVDNKLKIHVHNHPDNIITHSSPDNKAGIGDDLSFWSEVSKNSPDCRFYIYTKERDGYYVPYDAKGNASPAEQSRYHKPQYGRRQDGRGFFTPSPLK